MKSKRAGLIESNLGKIILVLIALAVFLFLQFIFADRAEARLISFIRQFF